ncbi:hypothetical protein ACFL1C_06465 [Pseudomonadota bacterium]
MQKLKSHVPVIRSSCMPLLWVIFLTLSVAAQPVLAQPVKIMPIGDWTEGTDGLVSYRYDLWFDLTDAGYDVDFVGSACAQRDFPNLDLYPKYLTDFDCDHEGVSSAFSSDYEKFASDYVEIAKLASAAYEPDIVLIWLGAYDIAVRRASGVALADSAIRDTINGIRSVVPGVTLLLGLVHRVPVLRPADVDALNDAITTIVSELDTPQSPVIAVDHVTGFDSGSMLNDDVHHNRVGETWVANNWFKVLANILPTPTAEPFQINSGLRGAWYNPDTEGQGVLLDLEPENQFMFLSWFTFTPADSDDPFEQHWYTAQGNYTGSEAELVVYETLGGKFDEPGEVDITPVGETTISFSDCSVGQMSYTIDPQGLTGSFPLQRAIPGSENVCDQQQAISTQSVDINAGMDGAWFDENTSGQGYLIDVHTNSGGSKFIFVAWFTYGDDMMSGQRWLTAQGNFEGSSASIDVYETTGGSFDDSKLVNIDKVGTMVLDFQDCNNALLTYSLTDDGLNNSIAISRAIPGSQVMCEELAGAD